MMDSFSLFIGDVLRYMACRDQIQDRVETRLRELCEQQDDDLWLVGHSLGGVIGFEFCQRTERNVARLITVGSQVGVLAEMGALQLAPTTGKFAKPDRIGTWLNLYDPNDMLSFLAAPVFGDVRDIQVKTGAPFPLSHSEYWARAEVYAALTSV
jgi:pimeloyl-ACP methyl ester carboxylesterase